MTAAQKLYQEGHITYMRTDSVTLSSQAITAATDFIKRLYGIEDSHVRKFKTKSANAQEAHEAIRPTDISREAVSGNEYDQKLYDLIRRRTLASQMAPATLENTTITIEISPRNVTHPVATSHDETNDVPHQLQGEERTLKFTAKTQADVQATPVFEAKGQVVIFDGFLRVYGSGKEDTLLPAVASGDSLAPHTIEARQVFARPPARFTEGM